MLDNSGEETAKRYEITREQQDDHALESYRRAAAGWASGAFTAEIAPVTIVDKRKGDTVVVEDEEYKKIRADKVKSLRPVFQSNGTITAANASNLNDGASALILASQEKIDEYGLTPLARIVCELISCLSPLDFLEALLLTYVEYSRSQLSLMLLALRSTSQSLLPRPFLSLSKRLVLP